MSCAWLVRDKDGWRPCGLPERGPSLVDASSLCRLHLAGEFAAATGAVGHDDATEVGTSHSRLRRRTLLASGVSKSTEPEAS